MEDIELCTDLSTLSTGSGINLPTRG